MSFSEINADRWHWRPDNFGVLPRRFSVPFELLFIGQYKKPPHFVQKGPMVVVSLFRFASKVWGKWRMPSLHCVKKVFAFSCVLVPLRTWLGLCDRAV
ncbi:hypothetical protein [Yoonia algicola]|uniref:Uncharacterized protein n=1 Tax=Yoonia algicola TaxID=3137368 RepID=A0AAN0M6B0_9RHOB